MKIPLINRNNPLPTAYTPKKLIEVEKGYFMEARAGCALKNMIYCAKQDGVELSIYSAYRSIEYQQKIFDEDVQRYIEQGMTSEQAYETTALSIAIPGESEHNAGLAVDIATPDWEGEITTDFENTPQFEWLSKNACNFGFILRYPKGKENITGITYEPWHYRYVTRCHAQTISRMGCTLEEYLNICK